MKNSILLATITILIVFTGCTRSKLYDNASDSKKLNLINLASFFVNYAGVVESTVPARTNLSSIPVTITFKTPVTDFDVTDIVVTNATISGFSGSGTTYTFIITPLAEGPITVDVPSGAAKDPDGNPTGPVKQLAIVYDTTAYVSSVSIVSNNPNGTCAKVGETVYVILMAGEDFVAPSATINGLAATVSGGPVIWIASRVMTAGDTEGPVTFMMTGLSDVAGNPYPNISAATDATSVLFDRTLPVIGPVHIASNNTNPVYARSGDTVTVSFTASENIQGPGVTINGKPATVSGGPLSWNASYTAGPLDSEGVISFSIVNILDPAGNMAGTVSATTDASSVTLYSAPLSISPVHIASNNANTSYAKVGDVVTVSFTSNHPLMAPAASIAGFGATVSGGPTSWTATYTMTAGGTEGIVGFTLSSLQDPAGNTATNVSATTDVSSVTFYKTAPAISPVHIVSNNGNNQMAKPGDMVTLTFTAGRNIPSPTVTIGGNTASVAGGPLSWTATYTMIPADTAGTVLFSISNIKDLAGNSAANVTATTDATSITFDKTSPSLSPVHIASNNGTPTLAKPGNTITLSFTSSENIAAPAVTIAGNAAVVSGGPLSWTATYTMAGGDPAGAVAFSISSILDGAGNGAAAVTVTTDASSVTYDKTAPALNPVSIASNNANPAAAKPANIVTVSFTSSENIAAPSAVIAGHTAVVAGGPTNWTATCTMVLGDPLGPVAFTISGIQDAAGNAAANVSAVTDTTVVTYSETGPTLTSVSIASNNGTPSYAKVGNIVTVSFTSDVAIQTPTVTISGQAAIPAGGPTVWTASYTMTGIETEGVVTFLISNIKDLGNAPAANVSAVTDASSVTYYKTAPVLSPVSVASNNGNTSYAKTGDVVTVSFTSNRPIVSPTVTIAGFGAAVSGGPTAWTATYTMTAASGEGVVPFTISTIQDLAGNNAANVSGTTDASSVTFYKTAPVLNPVHIASNNGNPAYAKVGDTVTLTFTSNRAISTPVVAIGAGAASVSGGPTVWSAAYTMTGVDGEAVVTFTISSMQDLAGNTAANESNTTDLSSVTFFKTAPVISPVMISSNNAINSKARVGDTVGISFTSSRILQAPTGVIAGNTATIGGGGTSWTATYIMAGGDSEGPVTFTLSNLTDMAGNTATSVSSTTDLSTVTFDKTGPGMAPVSIASNNSDPSMAKPGDTVTLSFTSSEDIQTPTVTIAGNPATIGGGPAIWTATYTLGLGDSEGNIPFIISNIKDLAGNLAAGNVTVVTDATSVAYDKTAPGITPISIASNNPNPVWAKSGNTVTLSFTASEPIQTPTVTIGGNPASVGGGPLSWTATWTMNGTDTEGAVSFYISNVFDIAGVAGSDQNAVTDGSSVTYDRTPPYVLVATGARTMDINGNGQIDHYKITFSEAVKDSSFPGYRVNSLGDPQTDWFIAGHTGVVLAHGAAAPAADTVNDDMLYVKFDEYTQSDTGSKPDMTTTGSPGITDLAGNPLALVDTIAVSEKDGAPPILVTTIGAVGSDIATLVFSEAADTSDDGLCSSLLNQSDFSYVDVNGSGASSNISMPDTNACNGQASIQVNNKFIAGDIDQDRMTLQANKLYDVAGNSAPAANVLIHGFLGSAKCKFNTTATGADVASNVTNFPVLIRIKDPAIIDTVQNGSPLAKDVPDIRFVDPDGTILLYEIERWDKASDLAEVWVLVTQIDGNSTADYITLYYNDKIDGTIPDGQKPAAVFNYGVNNFAGVWHMNNATGTAATDSSPNGYSLTNGGAGDPIQTTGLIGYAQDFSGTANSIYYRSASMPGLDNIAGSVTVSAWVKPFDGENAVYQKIISKKQNPTDPDGYELQINTASEWIEILSGNSFGRADLSAIPLDMDTNWHHFVGTVNGTSARVYYDGIDRSGVVAVNSLAPSTREFIVGASSITRGFPFKGIIDEVRVENIERSADWIKLCYENQSQFQKLVTIPAPWYNPGWLYRKKVNVKGSMIAGSLTDFPVYLRLNDLGGDFFTHVKSDGSDIVVTGSDGVTKLSRELVSLNTGGSQGELWVKVPQMNPGNDAVIHVYYGNPAGVEVNDPATWSNGFKAVWHFESNGTADSAGFNNSGTKNGAVTYMPTSYMGGGYNFNGTTAYISVATQTEIDITNDLTITAWIKPGADTAANMPILSKKSSSINPGYSLLVRTQNASESITLEADGANSAQASGWTPGTVNAGTWYYIASTQSGTGANIFLDGNGSWIIDPTINGLTSDSTPLRIGNDIGSLVYFNGDLDEVRLSSVARPPQWIQTEYANQSNPGNFFVIFLEENP